MNFDQPKEKEFDLATPEGRQEFIDAQKFDEKETPRVEQEQKEQPEQTTEKEKEKSPEEILNEKRASYAGAYNSMKVTGFKKEEDLQFFEATLEPLRKHIAVGDSEKLKLKNDSQEYREAEERKHNFINELIKKGVKKQSVEAFYNVELTKAEYENSKQKLAENLISEGAEKHEIFQKFIIDERELLNKAKVESWPPKDKTIFKKGMEWWMRRNTATRLLISTGLITGVVATVGGFSASAIAMFAGYRYVRGAGSVLVGKLAGMGFDRFASKSVKTEKEDSLSKLKTGFDLNKLKDIEKEYQEILEESAGKERKKLIVKAIIMAAAGAGTAIGAGMLEQAYAGGIEAAPTELVPDEISEKPGLVDKFKKLVGIGATEEVKPEIAGDVPEANLETTPETVSAGITVEKGSSLEGSIIEQLEENPEMMEKYNQLHGERGFDAGQIAHRMALDFAGENVDKFPDGPPSLIHPGTEIGINPETMEITEINDSHGAGYLPEKEIPAQTVGAEKIEMSQAVGAETVGAEKVDILQPEAEYGLIIDRLSENFKMDSNLYDAFANENFKEIGSLSREDFTGIRNLWERNFWENWNVEQQNKFLELQNKMNEAYDKLPLAEKLSADKMQTADFIKKYFDKLFSK